jgi:hypothetical protein
MLFDAYLFADYSGARDRAAQRKAIRLANADGTHSAVLVDRTFTRDELVDEFVLRLREASRRGQRICLGQDHQYGIPIGLGRELGIAHMPWSDALHALCTATYGRNAPPLSDAATFGSKLNRWLELQGQPPYFFSATKGNLYGIPSRNPRVDVASTYRLTEMCRPASRFGAPKPFNRLGDNGTVGGQSLVGLIALRNLLVRCAREGIPIGIWPFDGLSILDPAYANAHVLLEPYPTAVREAQVAQTDASDALASANHLQAEDRSESLPQLLDLSGLDAVSREIVRFEGWIVSHVPRPQLAGAG